MAHPVIPRRIPWHLILIFFLLSLGILSTGYFYYNHEQLYLKEEKLNEIRAIADLKIKQIVDWRKERLADATLIMKDTFFIAQVKKWLESGDNPEFEDKILHRLKALLVYQYQNIVLLDGQGRVVLSVVEEKQSLNSHTKALALEAIQTGKVIFSDLYSSMNPQVIRLSILVPLLLSQGTEKVPVGVILMRIDPQQFLYPLIQSWPTPSRSAETVLVRREGDEVVVLNELRNRQSTALPLRFSIQEAKLPAAMAVRGKEGAVEGVDYRGVPVVAVVGGIPDSPWYLVTKVDTAEIDAPLQRLFRIVLLLLIFLITGAGGSLSFIWSNQQMRFFRRQYEIEQEREKALQKLNQELMQYAAMVQDLYNHAPCGYHSLDPEGKFVQINDTELAWLGYSRAEVLGQMNFADLLTPESLQSFRQSLPVFKEKGEVYDLEFQMRRKDGTVFPVLLNATAVTDEAGKFIMSRSTVYDISDRKRAEQSLRESEERLRLLASQLLTAQEQERKRLAGELHDELGHALLTLKLSLGSISRQLPPEQENVQNLLRDQLEYINHVIEDVRRLYYDLSPGDLEDLGLTEALKNLIEEFGSHQPDITWQVDLPDLKGHLSLPAQTIIYRLVQEALTNIGKHAEPTRVSITAREENRHLKLVIADDGRGFDLKEVEQDPGKGIGLAAMRERLYIVGGALEIWSRKGQGTRLTFIIPALPEDALRD